MQVAIMLRYVKEFVIQADAPAGMEEFKDWVTGAASREELDAMETECAVETLEILQADEIVLAS